MEQKKKITITFKVSPELKTLLEQLVIIKTMKDFKRTTQHDVFEEALLNLLSKYKEKHE